MRTRNNLYRSKMLDGNAATCCLMPTKESSRAYWRDLSNLPPRPLLSFKLFVTEAHFRCIRLSGSSLLVTFRGVSAQSCAAAVVVGCRCVVGIKMRTRTQSRSLASLLRVIIGSWVARPKRNAQGQRKDTFRPFGQSWDIYQLKEL